MLSTVKWKGFILPLVFGIGLWLVTPLRPLAISIVAWRLFAIFVATIIACITKPLPMMAVTLIGIVVATLSGVVTMDEVATGFGNSTAWMVAMCMFMAAGFIKSGLGKRIAYLVRELVWQTNAESGLRAILCGCRASNWDSEQQRAGQWDYVSNY